MATRRGSVESRSVRTSGATTFGPNSGIKTPTLTHPT